jgi:hypothetical protein
MAKQEEQSSLNPNSSFGFVVGDDYVITPPGHEPMIHGTFVGCEPQKDGDEYTYFYVPGDTGGFQKTPKYKDCVGFSKSGGIMIAACNGVGDTSFEEAENIARKEMAIKIAMFMGIPKEVAEQVWDEVENEDEDEKEDEE